LWMRGLPGKRWHCRKTKLSLRSWKCCFSGFHDPSGSPSSFASSSCVPGPGLPHQGQLHQLHRLYQLQQLHQRHQPCPRYCLCPPLKLMPKNQNRQLGLVQDLCRCVWHRRFEIAGQHLMELPADDWSPPCLTGKEDQTGAARPTHPTRAETVSTPSAAGSRPLSSRSCLSLLMPLPLSL